MNRNLTIPDIFIFQCLFDKKHLLWMWSSEFNRSTTQLQKIYEFIIATKLRLGSIFLRAVLYLRRNAVGIRLIWLEIVIVILTNKLFIKNIRATTRLNKLIQYNEEAVMVEYSLREIK